MTRRGDIATTLDVRFVMKDGNVYTHDGGTSAMANENEHGTGRQHPWHLKQAWYFSLTAINDAVSQHGVSTAQIGILRQLADEPGPPGAELARRLLITPQGVRLALKALETARFGGAQAPTPARPDPAGVSDRSGPSRRGRGGQRCDRRA